MIEEIRRAVTGHDSDGKSYYTHAEVVPPTTALLYPGATYWLVWGTDGPQKVGSNLEPVHDPFFPNQGGARFLVVRFAAGEAAGEGAGTHTDEQLAEMHRDASEKFPGLFEVHAADPENAAFHTTDTIDYGFVVEGELWLQLDNGHEQRLTPGSTVVQRGTRHAWINKSDEPALVVYVLTGAERVN